MKADQTFRKPRPAPFSFLDGRHRTHSRCVELYLGTRRPTRATPGGVVAGRAETRCIKSLPYCDVCSMPFEFCEWGPLFKKCKENFEENEKVVASEIESEEVKTELSSDLFNMDADF